MDLSNAAQQWEKTGFNQSATHKGSDAEYMPLCRLAEKERSLYYCTFGEYFFFLFSSSLWLDPLAQRVIQVLFLKGYKEQQSNWCAGTLKQVPKSGNTMESQDVSSLSLFC